MFDKDGIFVIVGVVEELKVSDDKIVYIIKFCEDVKWLNGDFVIVNDYVYLWCCVVDFNIVVIYFYLFDVIKNGGDIVVGKKKFEELGIKVVDDYILEVILFKLIVYINLLFVFLIFFLFNEKFVMEKGEKYV